MARKQTVVEIDDLHTLELLNDPLRLRILTLLDEPRSVREVAESLGLPVTRLYYHVNMMEESGIIEVAESRKVGAMVQKLYRACGTDYRPAKKLLADIDDPRKFAEVVTATVIDGARIDAEEGLVKMFDRYGPEGAGPDAEKSVAIGRSVFSVPRHLIHEYVARLEALVEELQQEYEGDDQELYSFTYLMFPMAAKF